MSQTLIQRLRNMPDCCEADAHHEAADALERMGGWLECEANCPCCNQTVSCSKGCTFAEDCPNEVDRMASARHALYGDACAPHHAGL